MGIVYDYRDILDRSLEKTYYSSSLMMGRRILSLGNP